MTESSQTLRIYAVKLMSKYMRLASARSAHRPMLMTAYMHVQALSVNLRQQTLDAAGRNIGRLRTAIERVKATDADRLRSEYGRLVSGLQQQGTLPQPSRSPLPADDTLANPALPDDILREAVSPGVIIGHPVNVARGGCCVAGAGRCPRHDRLVMLCSTCSITGHHEMAKTSVRPSWPPRTP